METRKDLDLTGYREAMVCYYEGCSAASLDFAIMGYKKQLLMLVDDVVDNCCFNAKLISERFLKRNEFKHLSEIFDSCDNDAGKESAIDALHEELRNYVTDEELNYEVSDLASWKHEFILRVITNTITTVSESTGEFLREIYVVNVLKGMLFDDTDTGKCTGYAWLGANAAVKYGFANL